MTVNSLYDMLPTIIDSTINKKIKWHVDPSGGYFFSIGKNSVNIWNRGDQSEDESGYGVRLINSDNEVIEYIDTSYTYNKIDDYLSTIFALARRSALNVEKVIEEFYTALSSL